MVVFDGEQHVGQLQFRLYVPHTHSPKGLFHPLYWMDFQGQAPILPDKTLALFCYHVGQLDDTEHRDSAYFGRGIGQELLEKTIDWASTAGFEAIVAKGCPDYRPIIEFMGGLPTGIYVEKGFEISATYVDDELRSQVEKMLTDTSEKSAGEALKDINPERASEVSFCVKYLSKSI